MCIRGCQPTFFYISLFKMNFLSEVALKIVYVLPGSSNIDNVSKFVHTCTLNTDPLIHVNLHSAVIKSGFFLFDVFYMCNHSIL